MHSVAAPHLVTRLPLYRGVETQPLGVLITDQGVLENCPGQISALKRASSDHGVDKFSCKWAVGSGVRWEGGERDNDARLLILNSKLTASEFRLVKVNAVNDSVRQIRLHTRTRRAVFREGSGLDKNAWNRVK
jgi:hypothetical protein